TLTCTWCSYSRRRRELYRDFSLDIPDSEAQPHHAGEGRAGSAVGGEVEGKGTRGGVFGLETLLEGFFQPSELNLLCERCGHDQVRAEHSLAELPGALVLHVKRFKPVLTSFLEAAPKPKPKAASPPGSSSQSPLAVGSRKPTETATAAAAAAAPAVVDISQDAGGGPAAPGAAAAGGGSDGGVTPPPPAIVGGGSTGESSRSGGDGGSGSGSHGGVLRSYGGVSYVKLRTPVSVPLVLDLEQFCTEYTGNAPSETLGKGVDSLDGLGIPSSPSPSCPAGAGAMVNATPKKTATAAARGGGGGGGGVGGRARPSDDGVSVDLSMREGWSSGRQAAAAAGRGQAGDDDWAAAGGDGDEGASNKPGGALWDSTNRRSGGGSRGVRETATEKGRRVAK
ncbi:unnamed protein product, partial [Hapterophycus canaliculatus]